MARRSANITRNFCTVRIPRLIVVLQFLGIGVQVVEFRPRRFDELESFRAHRAQRGPAEAQGIVGFPESSATRIDCSRRRNTAATIRHPTARARADANRSMHSRQNVGGAHLRVDYFAGIPITPAAASQ